MRTGSRRIRLSSALYSTGGRLMSRSGESNQSEVSMYTDLDVFQGRGPVPVVSVFTRELAIQMAQLATRLGYSTLREFIEQSMMLVVQQNLGVGNGR